MRVLRRFLSSVPALAALSEIISIVSSAKLPPDSLMQTATVPQYAPDSCNAWQRSDSFAAPP
jgi:hypothetical protein